MWYRVGGELVESLKSVWSNVPLREQISRAAAARMSNITVREGPFDATGGDATA